MRVQECLSPSILSYYLLSVCFSPDNMVTPSRLECRAIQQLHPLQEGEANLGEQSSQRLCTHPFQLRIDAQDAEHLRELNLQLRGDSGASDPHRVLPPTPLRLPSRPGGDALPPVPCRCSCSAPFSSLPHLD